MGLSGGFAEPDPGANRDLAGVLAELEPVEGRLFEVVAADLVQLD